MLDERKTLIFEILKNALKSQSYHLAFQPIFSVKEQCCNKAEALIRLVDDELGMIYPDEFIPQLVKNQDIIEVGYWVVEEVCRVLSKLTTVNCGISCISCNADPIQFRQVDFAERILSILSRSNTPAEKIEVEITESGRYLNDAIVMKNMEILSQNGVRVTIDDLGKGGADLLSLLTMPVQMFKIDKQYIDDVTRQRNIAMLIKNFINFANYRNLQVTAEGVETLEQKLFLEKLNCHYLQGYYFSKPITEHELLFSFEAHATAAV